MIFRSTDSVQHDVRRFPHLKRRLFNLQNRVYVNDFTVERAATTEDGDSALLLRTEMEQRNILEEIAEIEFVLDYFQPVRQSWPRIYYFWFGFLILVSTVLSLVALLWRL